MCACSITQSYDEEYDPRSVILTAEEFATFSTKNEIKGYNPGQSIFRRDMILLVRHTVNWELIRQRK